MSRAINAVVLLVTLTIAGCSGGEEQAVPTERLSRLVLQPADLSSAYLRFDEGEQGRADAPQGARADPGRFGREGGWKARYRRPGPATTRGPLVIESRADVFVGDDGAKKDFEALAQDIAATGTAEKLEAPSVGDETIAVTLVQPAQPRPVRFFTVAWRYRNVTATIVLNGFDVSLGDAVSLARKQQRRIANAAG
jgi:hypothetical protein